MAGPFHPRQQLQLLRRVKVSPREVVLLLPQFVASRSSTSRPADNAVESGSLLARIRGIAFLPIKAAERSAALIGTFFFYVLAAAWYMGFC